ncbi:hypothetical protein KEM48_006432 [Puccinia striiformis f. sp. tritici PST-130]|nr:hypothetical protein KEM48_006432 [Puccinia striiformis f. sp. tritici PST-130]
MKNSPSWSEVPNLLPLHRETPETSIQRPLADFETLSKNLLKHPLEPFDETLLALGGHIPAQASKRRQTSLPSADPCVKSPSEKAITKFPSVTHKLKPGFPGNPELMIKNQLKRGRHKQLPRIQDLNEHQSKDGVPSSPRGIAGHGTIHLMNPDGAISLAQHRMMLVDRLNLMKVFLLSIKTRSVSAKKAFTLVSFYLDMIGTILQNYHDAYSDGSTSDIGSIMIKKAWEVCSQLTADKFLDYRFESKSSAHRTPSSFTRLQLCWNWIAALITGLEDENFLPNASEDLSWEPLDRWFLHSEDVAPNSSMDRFLPLPRMQSAEPKIDTPVQPYLQHHEKQAAAFDTGKAIMSSIQHTGQHGASGVPTIPNNPRATESYPLHRELLSGLDWELPNFAAPELHYKLNYQPKHPHQDNRGSPLGPLSVDDYEIEDWPLPAQDGPMSEDSGEPVMTTGTKYSLCHQLLVRSFDWELPNILAHESHRHQKPPQPIMDLSSSPSLKNHNSEALLLPEEIGEMMNSQSWSDSPDLSPLQMEMPEIPIQHPLKDCGTVSQNLLKHPLEPFDESLLALGGHIQPELQKGFKFLLLQQICMWRAFKKNQPQSPISNTQV